MTDFKILSEGRKVRIVTPAQFKEGYTTFANGYIMRHVFKLIYKQRDGNYVVVEPEWVEMEHYK